MFTLPQILTHFVGDYVLQSSWMANNKTKRFLPAYLHALSYSLLFLFLFHPSYLGFLVIFGSHYLIDRYRLARYVIWLKERLFAPPMTREEFKQLTATGYSEATPAFLAVWLLIITDNLIHIVINALALYYL